MALVVVSVIALNSATGMNAYSAHLTVLTAIASFRTVTPNRANRIRAILALSVLWCTIAINLGGDYLTSLNNTLVIMLYLLIPWSALNLVDFFVVRRSHYAILDIFKIDGIYGVWAWRGLLSYAGGFVAMLPFVVTSFYVGPVARAIGDIDIAWIVGLVVSGGVYLVLSRSLDREAEAAAVRASEQDMIAAGLEQE